MAHNNQVHSLYMQYYANRTEQKPRELCIRCGKPRVLGKRKPVKGICKKCRKINR